MAGWLALLLPMIGERGWEMVDKASKVIYNFPALTFIIKR